MKNYRLLILVLILFPGLSSCNALLDERSDKGLVVPGTLQDLQALLDSYSYMSFSDPSEGEVSSTDYYVSDDIFNSATTEEEKRLYTWQPDFVFPPASNRWMHSYRALYYANSVIQHVDDVPVAVHQQDEYHNIKGQGYFYRAKILFNMAVIWLLAYDNANASQHLGLPLRKDLDFNVPSVRSTQLETFERIIEDLKIAAYHLPDQVIHVIRPSKPAAYAQLAKAYLYMGAFEEAGLYADSCLRLRNTLIDYNDLNPDLNFSFEVFNPEVFFHSVIPSNFFLNISRARIQEELYQLYADADLRKALFFLTNADGTKSFKGSYTGNLAPFGGFSVSEIMLIRMEALARQGELSAAGSLMRQLYEHRWQHDVAFPEFPEGDQQAMLNFVLEERRRELLMRGIRWYDLKRLNQEGANIELTRVVNGQTYRLPPNDLRWALPIPEDVIELSGMQQNPR